MPHVLGADFDKIRDRFPGDAPFGADVRYDATFENLKTEVLKLTAHSSLEGGVDWKSCKAWALEILGSKSKDLAVASYLAVILFVLDGYGGLADGLAILQKYLRDDWDGVFPRNRAAALEWLVTRLAPFIEAKAPEPFEIALLPPLRDQLSAFQEEVRQRLQDKAPSFGELNSALAAYLDDLQASPAAGNGAAPAESPAPSGTAAAPAPPPRPAAPPAAALPAGTSSDEIASRIRALLPALREADPLSPVPYRLLRSLTWDGLTAPPVPDPNGSTPGTTRIPPPRAQQKTALENLLAAGNWAALLNASEAAFQEGGGIFWLDLQRYTALALEGLGSPRAAEAIRHEVARLLERLSALPTFSFADRTVAADPRRPNERTVERTPFASEETRQWLETLKGDAAGGEAPAAFLPSARAVESAEPALSPADARTAQELLARQPAAAFDLLQAAVDKAPNQRSRFRTRLAAARLCLQANQAAWARALLEALLAESESFQFEDWEPETAADLYQLLALCYARPAKRGGPQDPEAARVQIENLRRKLFRIDMRAAAALEDALRK